jgi:hypothetical protein
MKYDHNQWTGAARAGRDEMMNMSIVERSHASAHSPMRIDQGSGGSLGYLYALAFVVVALTKGLMFAIKLREVRVDLPSLLNGASELCQASVSLGISLIESFPTIVIE